MALLVFGVALALRIVLMFVLHSPDEARNASAWAWGAEAACMGESLAHGHGYAGQWNRDEAPWDRGSGPSAWLPPAYPALLALLMRTFGGITPATAVALFVIQSLLSAATCVLLWWLGDAVGEARAGHLAAWLFALCPASLWNAAHVVWDTTLVAFAVTLFLWLLFRFGRSGTRTGAILLGLAFGALMMVNPAPASLVPIVLLVIARPVRGLWPALVTCAAFCIAAFLMCVPWMLRNKAAVGVFALRTNLGVELMVGNNDAANGRYQLDYHASHNGERFLCYRELGEVGFSAWAMDEAKRWIGAHPAEFTRLTLRRIKIFWIGEHPDVDPRREYGKKPGEDPRSWVKWIQHFTTGVLCLMGALLFALRRRVGWYFLGMLMLFPLPYYLTHVLERYRFPIEPLMVWLGGWLLLELWDRARATRRAAMGRTKTSSDRLRR